MKKYFKKVVCLSLTLALSLFLNLTTYASVDMNQNSDSTNSSLKDAIKQFETMSNEELNQYIDNIKNSYFTESTYSISSANTSPSLAWLAAAQILKNNGYTCTGELIKDSVNNQNYSENSLSASGLFSKKIQYHL